MIEGSKCVEWIIFRSSNLIKCWGLWLFSEHLCLKRQVLISITWTFWIRGPLGLPCLTSYSCEGPWICSPDRAPLTPCSFFSVSFWMECDVHEASLFWKFQKSLIFLEMPVLGVTERLLAWLGLLCKVKGSLTGQELMLSKCGAALLDTKILFLGMT